MGKPKRKGESGSAVAFITRNQAIKRLQLSLPEFRKLCILKGIYPRDPKRKIKGKDKTYYFLKDINYMIHDPLVSKFRDYRAWRKKVKKAEGRNDKEKVKFLQNTKPDFNLTHLVKERYPTFTDALRDLDDALTLIQLFAAMPVELSRLKPEHTERCYRLIREFQFYVAKTHSLRKVFVSIKGYYFQAEIFGQTITWIMPHIFTQKQDKDVDYRVMRTFLEFHQVLAGFVNYKLFHTLGLKYPPKMDTIKDAGGEFLKAVIPESIAASAATSLPDDETEEGNADPSTKEKLETLRKKSEQRLSNLNKAIEKIAATTKADGDEVEAAEKETVDAGDVFDEETEKIRAEQAIFENLFKGCVFYLSREVPVSHLEFVIRCFGGQVSWEGGYLTEDSKEITHQIIDRPGEIANKQLSREYIQPQYVFDCINARVLLPVELYAPGVPLPPHLSPFIPSNTSGYVPEYRKKLDRFIQLAHGNTEGAEELEADQVDASEEIPDEDNVEDDDEDEEKQKTDEDGSESGSDDDKADQMEVEPKKQPKLNKKQLEKQELDDQMQLATGMLPSKKRKTLEFIQKKKGAHSDRVEKLHNKRRKLDKGDMVVEGGLLKPKRNT